MTTRSATHYEIIGVSREATPDEIKAAFRAQAQIHHPDAGGDTEAFAAISVAHDVLADPVRRSDYDATLPSHGTARFSGWSRPSEPGTAPAAEAPRRPVAEAEGDDPAVFRRDQRPAFRRPMVVDEPSPTEMGTVDGADLRSNTPAEVAPEEPHDIATRRTDEIERPAPREGRWSFFGRRGRDEEREPETTQGTTPPESEERAPFSRRAPQEVDDERDDRAPFAPRGRETQPSNDDPSGEFAPAERRRPSRDNDDPSGEFAPSERKRGRRDDDFGGEFAPSEPRAGRRDDDFGGEFAPSEPRAGRRDDDFGGEFAPSERKRGRRDDDFGGEFAPSERHSRRY